MRHDTRRRLMGTLLAGPAAIAATWVLGSAARAASPLQQGWWWVANPGSFMGSPTPPAPPDVPATGLLIEGGTGNPAVPVNTSMLAYAGLVYAIPDGDAANTLTLAVVGTSATTPGAKLQLCPLANPALAAQQGGPMAQAPAFDCATSVTAGPNAAGTAYQFNIASLVREGNLAIAVLPTSPTDRVVFAHPDNNSLEVDLAPVSPSPSTTNASAEPALNDTTTPRVFASVPLAVLPDTTGTAAPVATPAPGPVTPVPAPGAPTTAAVPVLTSSFGNRPANAPAVGLVLAALLAGSVLWAHAGRDRGETLEQS